MQEANIPDLLYRDLCGHLPCMGYPQVGRSAFLLAHRKGSRTVSEIAVVFKRALHLPACHH